MKGVLLFFLKRLSDEIGKHRATQHQLVVNNTLIETQVYTGSNPVLTTINNKQNTQNMKNLFIVFIMISLSSCKVLEQQKTNPKQPTKVIVTEHIEGNYSIVIRHKKTIIN